MAYHAKRSPSSASRALSCLASSILNATVPNKSSAAGMEGTAAHFLAEQCLIRQVDANTMVGKHISINAGGDAQFKKSEENCFEVDEDMSEKVQFYLDYVRALSPSFYVEKKLLIEAITGEAGATGTSDFVGIDGTTLHVADLKYGRVKVEVAENKQLIIYGMGALIEFKSLGIEQVTLHIVMPNLNFTDSVTYSVDEMKVFYTDIKRGYEYIDTLTIDTLSDVDFHPSESNCRYCNAAAICPELNGVVNCEDFVIDENTNLAEKLEKITLIRKWCDAIEALAFDKLTAGETVKGYHIVQGKRGNRKWSSEEEVVEFLEANETGKDLFLKESFMSPADIQKLNKKQIISDELFEGLQAFITQSEGKPTLAKIEA